MKHLKTYENNEFKKYFISKILGTYGIFEYLGNSRNGYIKINMLFILDMLDNKLITQPDSPYSKHKNVFDDNILFTSDDLQECKAILPTIDSVNKYKI